MRVLRILSSLALVCALGAAATTAQEKRDEKQESKRGDDEKAQKLKIEPGQRYLLLSTMKTSTMQKELDEAASLGFRVIMGSPTSTSEMAVLTERVAEPSAPYRYKLLATTKIATMRKELNEAAQDGYRLLPRTMISKDSFLTVEVVMLLEKAPNSDKRYEYRLYATTSEKKMRAEIEKAEAEGFTLAGMVSRGEDMVIMEREYGKSQAPSQIP
ncbi:MAG: hypothetical protein QOJ76_1180 [Acidobacteriota bacterium]|jgi:hypothetical protein|nr:hypothetical protein [Acidobacteriota bacterium]